MEILSDNLLVIENEIEKLQNTKEKGDYFEKYCYNYIKSVYNVIDIWFYKDFPFKKQFGFLKNDTGIDIIFTINEDINEYKLNGDNDAEISYDTCDIYVNPKINGMNMNKCKKIRYNAVQCKYRTNRCKIIDMSTFYTCCYLSKVHLIPIIITNSYKCDKLTELNKEKVIIFNYNSLCNENISVNPDILQLNELQKKCMDNVMNNIALDKFTIIMSCGCGKSLIAYKIIKMLGYEKVVIIVPNLLLIEQFGNMFEKVWKNCEYGNIDGYKNGIMISTYQSIKNISDIEFDLIIYDEAHRTCSPEYGKSLELKGKKKIFMTATKKIIYDEDDDDYEILSMDNENLYGKIICDFPLSSAIKNGILCEFIMYNFDQQKKDMLSAVKYCIEHGRTKILLFHSNVEESMNCNKYLCDNSIESYHIDGELNGKNKMEILKKFKNGGVSVLNNVAVMKEGIDIKSIDCVIFNCKKSSEIDIIQCIGRCLRTCENKINSWVVVMTENGDNKNFIDIALNVIENDEYYNKKYRRNPAKLKKIMGHIKFDDKIYYDAKLTVTLIDEFTKKTMMTFDEKYKMLNEFIEKNNGKYPSRFNDDIIEKRLGRFVAHLRRCLKIGRTSDKQKEIIEKIPGWKWEIIDQDKSFNEKYDKLKEFLEKNNGKYPSRTGDEEEYKLHKFFRNKKYRYANGTLIDKVRIEKLEKLPGWKWKIEEEQKMKKIHEIKNFKEKYGFFPRTSSSNYINDTEKILGFKISKLRNDYRNGKIDENKKNKILEIIPEFDFENNPEDNFKKKAIKLKEFIINNGRYPSSNTPINDDEKRIANYVNIIRKKYKINEFPEERKKTLLEIIPDFILDPTLVNSFEDKVIAVKNFIEKNNKRPSSKSKVIEERKLGELIATMKKAIKKNKYDNERMEFIKKNIPEWIFK